MSGRLYLYPFWLRFWHWLNALLFLVLITTGASMHYAGEAGFLIPFATAVAMHNFAGVTLTFFYAVYFVANLTSGNYRHYIPKTKSLLKGLIAQGRYYLYGIFVGAPHPTSATADQKFNPLQQVTYLQIMYGLMPLILVTGWLLFFPEYLPGKVLGVGGVWPIAVGHSLLGFLGALFMLGHVYLGTTGHTPGANFKGMWTGWHEN